MKQKQTITDLRKILLISFIGYLLLSCADSEKPLFHWVPVEDSQLSFANHITENDTFNILDFEFVYNGGGVAAGDFNGDGLNDLYFSGNTTANALFLNEGELQFKDVTDQSQVGFAGRWCSGITTVDINTDGKLDIYVSATTLEPAHRRHNILLINEGNDEQGIPQFTNQAAAYGLDHDGHNTQAAFFDYDRDGDLDVYLLIDEMINRNLPNRYLPIVTDGSNLLNDRLLRNDPGADGHPVFTDVTTEAGILKGGYGLGINVCDLNEDGWPDIYVTNDYLTNDLLWINNQDGTFTDQAAAYFKHTAYSAMGNDVADLNGDGHDDLIALDMFPEDNPRRKAMMPANNYTTYLNNDRFGYLYQYTRNNLQLRTGTKPNGTPLYHEVGMQSGVAATDWSWSPLAADFDLDGDRDLLITNGFPKDVTDRDFMDYNVTLGNIASHEMLLAQIPSIKISNYGYENTGGEIPVFKKQTAAWGLERPSFSNGAVFADLDNDGDLDYVVNNINETCFLYENQAADNTGNDWVTIRLAGQKQNPRATGARLVLTTSSGKQTAYQHPVRGYLSSVPNDLHFGLGDSAGKTAASREPTSAVVWWPDGFQEEFQGFPLNSLVTLRYGEGVKHTAPRPAPVTPWLTEDTAPLAMLPVHRDCLFIDFNVQPLLPHKLSEYGPGIAVGDVNGDGLMDIYRSGSHFHSGELLLQSINEEGRVTFSLSSGLGDKDSAQEELGSLFFDADGDGDQDLYLVSGGSERGMNSPEYFDRLFKNDGQGNFTLADKAVPQLASSGSCVRAADYDRDGDLDLFVGGRLFAGHFPRPVDSYVLNNDGNGNFSVADLPDLSAIGLVCDALWTDYDADGWTDLLLAGQGMPLTFLRNDQGTLSQVNIPGLADKSGWWNGLTAADFDRDGDLDYAVANFGHNHLYRQNGEDYVALYGADFDGNGGFDLIPVDRSLGHDGQLGEYPHYQRRDTEKQISAVKGAYPKHADFGKTSIKKFLKDFPVAKLVVNEANYLSSAWVENLGNGDFALHALPEAAQSAPLFGLQNFDLDADGHPDLVGVGNDYGTETGMGRLDGLSGIALRFDAETKQFQALSTEQGGLFVPGNGRSLALLPLGPKASPAFLAAENQGPTRLFRATSELSWHPVGDMVTRLELQLADGKSSVVEIPYGSGFLSQNGRGAWLPAGAMVSRTWTFKGVEERESR